MSVWSALLVQWYLWIPCRHTTLKLGTISFMNVLIVQASDIPRCVKYMSMCDKSLIGIVQTLMLTLHCLLFCSYSCIIIWNDDGLKGKWQKQSCNSDLYSYFSQGKKCSSDFQSIWPFLKILNCFWFLTPRMLLLAPFINFRSLPRDGAKEPWDEIRPLWFFIYIDFLAFISILVWVYI